MEPLKFEIDGADLRQYLKDTGRSMQALSKEIGCGSGYMSNATLTNRMGKPQYLYMCHILGVDEDRFKHKPEISKESDESATEKGTFEVHITDPEIGEVLKRIEKDIVRLGQVALDIRGLLKGEPK